MKCEICGQDIVGRTCSFWYHICQTHKYDRKIYFDKFLKTAENSTCKICGKPTEWNEKTKTYKNFCSNACLYEQKTQTLEKHFGVKNVFQLESTKNKIKDTLSLKYNDGRPIENISQSKFWKNAVKETCNEKYGCDNVLKAKFVQDKIKRTLLEKYGVEHPLQNKTIHSKYEDTCLHKYGFMNAASSLSVKEKIKSTFKEKYGVEHVMQNHEIFCKTKKKYDYDGIMFDSKPEMEFYKKLKAENTDFEYQPDIFFEYEYEGKIHKYYPDFRIGDEYVELKGAHFFDENDKMINPFDSSQDALYEAKHQCMIKNNVKILIV